jgi:hypothetical protein
MTAKGQATARTKADPYGMATKRTDNSNRNRRSLRDDSKRTGNGNRNNKYRDPSTELLTKCREQLRSG